MMIAISIGLVSSWHCLAMCGPLFSGFLLTQNNSFLSFILFQTTRILTYGILGSIPLVFGIHSIPFEYMQIISIICGAIILLSIWVKSIKKNVLHNKMIGFIKQLNQLGRKFNGNTRFVFYGMANGLLPCGVVYIAFMAAIASSQELNPILFMLLFGIGTLPTFLILYLAYRNNNKSKFVLGLSKLKPLLLSIVALLLILRGLNLNIPYLSPEIKITPKQTTISCCHDKR